MLPWFAIVVLGLITLISASVWILGARLRARRGEEALPAFKSMMGRGMLAPVALLAMAADFGFGPLEWVAWTAIVLGTWLVTLVCVRAILRAVFGASRRSAGAVIEMEQAPDKMAS